MKRFVQGLIYFLVVYSGCIRADTVDSASVAGNDELQHVISLKCFFGDGAIGEWKNDGFKLSKASFNNIPIFFDSINIKNNTARMVGNAGSSNINIIWTNKNMTFIELTKTGNFIFTTIFPVKNKSGEFLAVTSRHLQIMDMPLPSQYYGVCKNWT